MKLSARKVLISGVETLQISTPTNSNDLTAALFGAETAELVLATYPNTADGQRKVDTLLQVAQRPLEAPF